MEKKKTQREMYDYIEMVNADNEEIVNFCEERKAVLDRKKANATKTTKQVENDNLKDIIVETLTSLNKFVTITELQEANENLQFDNEGKPISNQRITALLTQLYNDKAIDKQYDKRKAYFKNI